MSLEKRVFMYRNLSARSLVVDFQKLSTAIIADVLGCRAAMNCQLKRLSGRTEERMCGLALTAKVSAGDNLMAYAALDIAEKDDVLVLAAGTNSSAVVEWEMAAYGKEKGLKGIVLDGCVRELDKIQKLGLPVFAVGCTPGGSQKTGTGEVNVPVSCGGVSVSPGDIIVGDCDGIIVIPREDAGRVLLCAQRLNKDIEADLEKGLDKKFFQLLERQKIEVIS